MPINVKFDVILGKLREDDAPSGSFANVADLGNVLFVSIAGNDATGMKGRIDLPFQTISGANAVAGAGDLIYIFAGTYNESSIQKDLINYYFERGAEVNTAGIIWDGAGSETIVVRGYGRFISAGLGISITTPANFDIEGDYLEGATNAVFATNGILNLNIKVVKSIASHVVTIRGTCVSNIVSDLFDGSTTTGQNPAIDIRDHSLDLVPRTITFNIGEIRSNANGSFGAVHCQNTFNCTAIINARINHALTAPLVFVGGLFHINTGKIIYNGIAKTADGFGITYTTVVGGSSNMEFQSGLIQSPLQCLRLSGNSTMSFKQFPNAVLETTGNNTVVELGVGGYFSAMAFGNFESWGLIKNSLGGVVILPSCHGIRKEGALPNDTVCRLNGAKIITNTTAGVESLNTQGGLPQNVQIMSAYANQDITPLLFTNIIAGTNLVVDTDLTDNPII
jgi:hypothetical protein